MAAPELCWLHLRAHLPPRAATCAATALPAPQPPWPPRCACAAPSAARTARCARCAPSRRRRRAQPRRQPPHQASGPRLHCLRLDLPRRVQTMQRLGLQATARLQALPMPIPGPAEAAPAGAGPLHRQSAAAAGLSSRQSCRPGAAAPAQRVDALGVAALPGAPGSGHRSAAGEQAQVQPGRVAV